MEVDIEEIRGCSGTLKFTRHALHEMLAEEFGEISESEVRQILARGGIIEEYPEDRPVPSCLVYGKTDQGRHLHVVCAPVVEEKILVIVTVYEPDPLKWVDYRRRIK